MRILLASNCYPPRFIGGAELVVHRHARRLMALGHEVRVFTGDHSHDRSRHQCWDDEYEGINVTRVRITHQDSDHFYPNFLNRPVANHFQALLTAWRPDVAHFHNTTGISMASYHHCAARGIPVLVTLHDHWGFCLRNTLITVQGTLCQDISRCAGCQANVAGPRFIPISCRKDYLRRRFSSVRRFITPSAYLASRYVQAGFPMEKFEVISNGIDPVRPGTPRTDGEPCRFTTICYLGEHKGIHVIFEALRRLPRALDWRFNIVGVGHLEPALRRMARVAGLEHRIRFWGRLPNEQISAVFDATDVCVLASTWAENEPVSILEAFSHGIPVIASRVGGVPELVCAGVNGWLVTPSNAGELQATFAEAIRNPATIRDLAAGALRTGTRWPEQRQVARLLSVYERVCRERPETSSAPLIAIDGTAMPPAAVAAVAKLKELRPDLDVIPMEWLEPDELDSVCAVLETDLGPANEIADGPPRLQPELEAIRAWVTLSAPARPASRLPPNAGHDLVPAFVKD